MQTTTLNYKLIKKIKDERFDEDQIQRYQLLIHIGTRDIQIGVIEPGEARILLLEDYVLPNVNSNKELLEVLDQLFDSHPVIKAGFWNSIKVSIKNQKFVQVPSALFSEQSLPDYLQYNAAINPETEDYHYVSNKEANAITVFAINKDLKEWLNKTYPNKEVLFSHQSASLIDGVMNYAQNRSDNPLYVFVDRFKLHILSTSGKKLVYYNQFAVKQFSDYVRYIMLVLKSLKMDQATSQVVLWGYIGKNSPHYHEFYKYINNVTFGGRPDFLQFGYMFDEIQEHTFLDLFGIHLSNK